MEKSRLVIGQNALLFCFQPVEFFPRQLPCLSSRQIPQRKKALLPPLQIGHRHPPGGHHPAHLVVFSFADRDQALPIPQRLQLCRKTKGSVLQRKARGKGLHILRLCAAFMAGVVDFRHFLLGRYQPVQQVAVIGKQQQTFGRLVQPAHRL